MKEDYGKSVELIQTRFFELIFSLGGFKMLKRSILILTLAIVAMSIIYCSNATDPTNLTSVNGVRRGVTTLPPDPHNDRTNPLGIHIRDNWTSSDPDLTGGLHYDHIKVAGLNWYDMGNLADGDDQAEFIVDHYDFYTWGGSLVGDHADGQYTDFIWLMPAPAIPCVSSAWDSSETVAWLNNSALNTEGYTWEDLVIHWKYDGTSVYGAYQGWNPTDDIDGDGCRNFAVPSVLTRSAECITDAEIMFNEYESGRPWWNFAKTMHDGYLKMVSDRTIELKNAGDYEARGAFFDSGAFNEGTDFGFQNSFTYESTDLITSNRDYYLDKLLHTPTVAADYMEPLEPDMDIQLVNMVSPLYTCATASPSKDWAFEYLENIWLEDWIMSDFPNYTPMTTERISDYLDCPYLDWLEEDKGVVFCGHEYPPGTDRGQLFTLSAFYMINHQMAFYCYGHHDWINSGGDHVSDSWNPYVEYDIGQPAANSLGLDDFQGQSGTNLYFGWCDNANYKILGREYEKADGTRALVLSKIMASGGTEGSNPTTHDLGGCYRMVQSDLTLGPVINEITLTNNDGVILVKEDECIPAADFSANVVIGTYPLTVYFTDLSANYPDLWTWNFGNGGGSLLQNPHVTYTQAGTYTVSLIATNTDGSDTEVKTGYITVTAPSGGGKGDPFQQ